MKFNVFILFFCFNIVFLDSFATELDTQHDANTGWCSVTSYDAQKAQRVQQKIQEYKRTKGANDPQLVFAPIPVFFHVIRHDDGETGDVRDKQIEQQLQVLNHNFQQYSITFILDGIERINNTVWSECASGSDEEEEMFFSLTKDPAHILNVYLVTNQLGSSTYPWDYKASSLRHSIIINSASLPGGDMTFYNLGDTLVHEVGHYLGLYHTFENGCEGDGDYVTDTPAQAEPNWYCVPNVDTCPVSGKDPIRNFMNYTTDWCISSFTNGQIDRIYDIIPIYKPGLLLQSPTVRSY